MVSRLIGLRPPAVFLICCVSSGCLKFDDKVTTSTGLGLVPETSVASTAENKSDSPANARASLKYGTGSMVGYKKTTIIRRVIVSEGADSKSQSRHSSKSSPKSESSVSSDRNEKIPNRFIDVKSDAPSNTKATPEKASPKALEKSAEKRSAVKKSEQVPSVAKNEILKGTIHERAEEKKKLAARRTENEQDSVISLSQLYFDDDETIGSAPKEFLPTISSDPYNRKDLNNGRAQLKRELNSLSTVSYTANSTLTVKNAILGKLNGSSRFSYLKHGLPLGIIAILSICAIAFGGYRIEVQKLSVRENERHYRVSSRAWTRLK